MIKDKTPKILKPNNITTKYNTKSILLFKFVIKEKNGIEIPLQNEIQKTLYEDKLTLKRKEKGEYKNIP